MAKRVPGCKFCALETSHSSMQGHEWPLQAVLLVADLTRAVLSTPPTSSTSSSGFRLAEKSGKSENKAGAGLGEDISNICIIVSNTLNGQGS